MPLISVIVPVYKVEPYLHRCVDSILAQTFTDFELILVDDGSPDNCGAICDDYAAKDKRIHVIHQKNGGLSAARNAGIDWSFAHSDSQWLSFVDSDDWVSDRYLELLFFAAESRHVSISACLMRKAVSKDEFQDKVIESGAILDCSFEDYFIKKGNGVNVISAWGKLYQKGLFRDSRYPIGLINEDLFITPGILYASGKIALVERVLYFYFYNESSIMRCKWTPKRLDEIKGSEKLIRFIFFKNLPRARVRAFERYKSVLKTHIKMLKSPDIDRKYRKYQKRLIRKLRFLVALYGKQICSDKEKRKLYPSLFPKLDYLYWLGHGVKNKIKRIMQIYEKD